MAQKFKPGDKVRQVLPAPVEGTVVGFSLDQTTGDVQFHVAWKHTDADGEEHVGTRYFTQEQLEAVPEAPKEGGAA